MIEGLHIRGPHVPRDEALLSVGARSFLAMLQRRFGPRRQELLRAREGRQAAIDAGTLPDFPTETEALRAREWTVDPVPTDLVDRRVEITGPTDRKMVINALNSGARMFMADLEDSNCPTWDNMIGGQINLRDAINRSISFEDTARGKSYQLNEETATLIVRPRGWHLDETHILVDGKPATGGIVDFALYFYHNAAEALSRGTGPYFYLPKMEGHLEARLWNDIFVAAQDAGGIPQGTIRATVLIETILAAFEMDEILYELRDHSAGLNCGRWDYIFSYIKKFRMHANMVMPDRAQVTMTVPNMRAYSLLAVKTCHKRNAPCIGGMAAQIPVKGDAAANDEAFAKVRADKEREANDGHDGSWVAHPGLVPVALDAFPGARHGSQNFGQLGFHILRERLLHLILEMGQRNARSDGIGKQVFVQPQHIDRISPDERQIKLISRRLPVFSRDPRSDRIIHADIEHRTRPAPIRRLAGRPHRQQVTLIKGRGQRPDIRNLARGQATHRIERQRHRQRHRQIKPDKPLQAFGPVAMRIRADPGRGGDLQHIGVVRHVFALAES